MRALLPRGVSFPEEDFGKMALVHTPRVNQVGDKLLDVSERDIPRNS
jgi:hypothetical protein